MLILAKEKIFILNFFSLAKSFKAKYKEIY